MINPLNSAFKPLTIALAVALLFSSCKKKELTSAEWAELAKATMNDMKELTTNIPCGQLSETSIQEMSNGCSSTYYAVKASDQAKFDKLKKEYLRLLSRQSEAANREGFIVDPCSEFIWIAEQPIRLECKDGKIDVITSADISIEEARPLALQTYQEIMNIVNAQTCTSGSDWTAAPLLKDKIMVEYIPALRTANDAAFRKKVSLYNSLTLKIIQAQGATPVPHQLQVDKVDCVNGKPVIKYRN